MFISVSLLLSVNFATFFEICRTHCTSGSMPRVERRRACGQAAGAHSGHCHRTNHRDWESLSSRQVAWFVNQCLRTNVSSILDLRSIRPHFRAHRASCMLEEARLSLYLYGKSQDILTGPFLGCFFENCIKKSTEFVQVVVNVYAFLRQFSGIQRTPPSY